MEDVYHLSTYSCFVIIIDAIHLVDPSAPFDYMRIYTAFIGIIYREYVDFFFRFEMHGKWLLKFINKHKPARHLDSSLRQLADCEGGEIYKTQ